MKIMKNNIELSIVMPCLNEADTLKICIDKASSFLRNNNIIGEIVVADNGSTDSSVNIAEENGARVVIVEDKGYGNALRNGILAAKGKYVIMGDSDDSYNFLDLMPFLLKLREEYDFVMGNRFMGGITKGAMPFLHQYFGVPLLTFLGKVFFGCRFGDVQCGLRGFSKNAFFDMDLKTPGMEFAYEMIVSATLKKMKVTEVATTLSPDGRARPPHLRTWRDGWRNLRFLLMYCPRWLFLYPGMLLSAIGLLFSVILTLQSVTIGSVTFDVHTLLYSAISIVIGFQSIAFYVFTNVYGSRKGFIPPDSFVQNYIMKLFRLETGLIMGILLFLLGVFLSLFAFYKWNLTSFGDLDPQIVLRIVIPGAISLLLGMQIFLYSFFLSILRLK